MPPWQAIHYAEADGVFAPRSITAAAQGYMEHSRAHAVAYTADIRPYHTNALPRRQKVLDEPSAGEVPVQHTVVNRAMTRPPVAMGAIGESV